jgi:hypothetical protein
MNALQFAGSQLSIGLQNLNIFLQTAFTKDVIAFELDLSRARFQEADLTDLTFF